MSEKTYLGDGVYVEVERGMLRLTSEDGIHVLNEIFLEPEVFSALLKFVQGISQPKAAKGE